MRPAGSRQSGRMPSGTALARFLAAQAASAVLFGWRADNSVTAVLVRRPARSSSGPDTDKPDPALPTLRHEEDTSCVIALAVRIFPSFPRWISPAPPDRRAAAS